jgi:hypothetical protein
MTQPLHIYPCNIHYYIKGFIQFPQFFATPCCPFSHWTTHLTQNFSSSTYLTQLLLQPLLFSRSSHLCTLLLFPHIFKLLLIVILCIYPIFYILLLSPLVRSSADYFSYYYSPITPCFSASRPTKFCIQRLKLIIDFPDTQAVAPRCVGHQQCCSIALRLQVLL